MSKFLDEQGLDHLWGKIKAYADEHGGGITFTTDDTLDLDSSNVLSVTVPTEGMTQAEYDALSETEKNKGLKVITDGVPTFDGVKAQLFLNEYDTDDGWHVRKWSNGYLEMERTDSVTCASDSDFLVQGSWTSLIQTIGRVPVYAYPISLIRLCSYTITQRGPGFAFWAVDASEGNENSLTETAPYVFTTNLAKTSNMTSHYPFTLYGYTRITGLWKELDSDLYALQTGPSVEDYTTEDGWHVRKYSDGYVELHRAFSNSLAVSDWADSANGWNALLFKFYSLPITLTARYSETLSLNGTSSGATAIFYQDNSYYSKSTTGWWQAFRPWSKPTGTINLETNLAITGRWK